ncbi:ankyrin repeat-containing protein [Tanacetum coccineum]
MLSSLSIRQRQTNEWMRWRRSLTKPPPRLNETARRTYDDIGLELHNSNAGSNATIGKNLRPKHWDVEGSNKLHPGTTNDMNDERLKPHTEPHTDSLFVEGMQPTGFGREFGVDPQAAVDREMRHMIETNQRGEREHRGAGTNQAGDRFAYHGFEHRMRKLKMPVFEGEALSWYRWSEGRTPFHSWDGFKRRLLIRFQQSKEGNLYEQFLAITQEGSARAYVALFEKLACQLLFKGVMQSKGVAAIVGQTTSKGDNFRRMTESEIRKAKGLCFRCEKKYTPGHRCASRTLQVMLVDENDEEEEPDLNFKSWDRGPKID